VDAVVVVDVVEYISIQIKFITRVLATDGGEFLWLNTVASCANRRISV
jgi:hypothetical protein